jgi:hypothetical protein
VRHVLAWLFTLVLAAAGTLLAHAAAYLATGEEPWPLHAYLGHAPQLLVILATLAAVSLAATRGAANPPAWPFPVLAVGAFVAQEHLERLLHTGELPWLLTSPAFLVGLAFQLPFALAAWWLAGRMLRSLMPPTVRARLLPSYLLAIAHAAPRAPASRAPITAAARGPPLPLRAR